ncbi:MAG: hypothetical protein RI900_2967 [Actinomycetota bacterium]|jgi:hypothetical protein
MRPDDERRLHEYRWALAGFRLDRGDCLESVVAALLDAMLLLHDPGRCSFVGQNPFGGIEYHGVAARIWERLVQHYRVHDEFLDAECRAIVFEEIEADFRAVPLHDALFCEIVGREFGTEVYPLVPGFDTTFHDPPNIIVGFVEDVVNTLRSIDGFNA